MKVNYIFRHSNLGHSIEKVFRTVTTEVEKKIEVTEINVLQKNSMPWDLVRNIIHTFKNRSKTGVNHITGHVHECILGLIGCKSIITIHDLVFLDNVKNPIKKLYKYIFWLYLPIKLADKIVCISEHTKLNILKHIKTDNIIVIHNPVDPKFTFSPRKFNSQKPIILHVGTAWNKNLHKTILSLATIPCHLRIVGTITKNTKKLLEEKKISYSNVSHLSDDEMRIAYQNCDIISFASVYEGFGMPIIEGQAIGRAVLTSNLQPMKEVGGNAAHYVDPNSVESIKNGFSKLIADEKYRNELIHFGLENVKRFQAKEIAKQYIDLYQSL